MSPDRQMLLSAFVLTSVRVSSLPGLPGMLLPALDGLLSACPHFPTVWIVGFPSLAGEGISRM